MRRPTRAHPTAVLAVTTAVLAAGGCRGAAPPPPDYASLRDSLSALVGAAPGRIGLALVDLATDSSVEISADVSMHAASTMKVPVLLELFRQAAAGRFDLDDSVLVRNAFTSIADSSRFSLTPDEDSEKALYDLVGRRATLRDLARRMIDRSSNLATDNLIDLVGADSVQRLMRELGTTGMVVLRGVEDLPAFDRGMNNTTTARALAGVLAALARCERGNVADALRPLDPDGCHDMTDILAGQEFNLRIPAALPPGTRVAHKTGWITKIDHDAGIIYPPDRAPYVLAVLTHDFPDTLSSEHAIRHVSALAWRSLVGR